MKRAVVTAFAKEGQRGEGLVALVRAFVGCAARSGLGSFVGNEQAKKRAKGLLGEGLCCFGPMCGLNGDRLRP